MPMCDRTQRINFAKQLRVGLCRYALRHKSAASAGQIVQAAQGWSFGLRPRDNSLAARPQQDLKVLR
jgi:hypothetical protein